MRENRTYGLMREGRPNGLFSTLPNPQPAYNPEQNRYTYIYGNNHINAVNQISLNGTDYYYTYDYNGNMNSGPDFTDPSQIASRTITYNADNMPVQIEHAGTVVTDFIYDGDGVRVKKDVQGGGETYYVNEKFEVINGEPVRYIFAGNLRIAKVAASGRNYFHKDHLGSSTVMTDETGTLVEASEYMPFGHMRDHIGTETSNYKFTDQELDRSTNLYNYDARLYDPVIGRFISPDSIVPDLYNPQALDRYAYTLNNPLKYTDPSGHDVAIVGRGLLGILGMLGAEHVGIRVDDTVYSYGPQKGLHKEISNNYKSWQKENIIEKSDKYNEKVKGLLEKAMKEDQFNPENYSVFGTGQKGNGKENCQTAKDVLIDRIKETIETMKEEVQKSDSSKGQDNKGESPPSEDGEKGEDPPDPPGSNL